MPGFIPPLLEQPMVRRVEHGAALDNLAGARFCVRVGLYLPTSMSLSFTTALSGVVSTGRPVASATASAAGAMLYCASKNRPSSDECRRGAVRGGGLKEESCIRLKDSASWTSTFNMIAALIAAIAVISRFAEMIAVHQRGSPALQSPLIRLDRKSSPHGPNRRN